MKLHFQSDLAYQKDAIDAVVGLFEGQTADDMDAFELTSDIPGQFPNKLSLSEEQILKNLHEVQAKGELPLSSSLDGMHFSIEMETGTGKTYVYLRTIYELNRQYGFRKFVIVVPSVAIREGVLKNLDITHDHFQNLYDHVPIRYYVYNRNDISQLRGFATGDHIEVLVINIDSFAKDKNVINKRHETGVKPIQYIQSARPVVIIDEPQNMETEKRSAAIANLNPLCTLRYSATHRNRYNPVYSLNPIRAYDLGLVKQIEVDSVLEENAFNDSFVVLESIKPAKKSITAKVTIDINGRDGVIRKTVTVKTGDDLYRLSNEREIYRNRYIVNEIDASNGCLVFSNGIAIYTGERRDDLHDEIMKYQIRRTIEEHLRKEQRLNPAGIKVLSLFFIDRVANYRTYDASGKAVPGKLARWFEEIYREVVSSPRFRDLDKYTIDDIHNGYFSEDKKGKLKDTSGETDADNSTYNLIMRDKEKLLDMNSPLRFIFSHTALREGWDNPNVFQICTLNETRSEMKKRQEIGRGLRLAVDQNGNRCYDRHVNRLTVIANESYSDFAKALQNELREDCGIDFENRLKNARQRIPIRYRKGFQADPRFLEIWERIRNKTTYRVRYDTKELIAKAGTALSRTLTEISPVTAPVIHAVRTGIGLSREGIVTRYLGEQQTAYRMTYRIPDVLGYIQDRTELTRHTLMQILQTSGRLDDLPVNPQQFMDTAVSVIRQELYNLMIDGIVYHRIGDESYEMRLFENQELEVYLDNLVFQVSDPDKTIYETYMPLDSEVENRFARDCETSEQVKFYFKLPDWFKIPTPVGFYNPDWAVVFEDDKRIYFVAETKDTGTPEVDLNKLRENEQQKIKCGKAHFMQFADVEYRVVNRVGGLIQKNDRPAPVDE